MVTACRGCVEWRRTWGDGALARFGAGARDDECRACGRQLREREGEYQGYAAGDETRDQPEQERTPTLRDDGADIDAGSHCRSNPAGCNTSHRAVSL